MIELRIPYGLEKEANAFITELGLKIVNSKDVSDILQPGMVFRASDDVMDLITRIMGNIGVNLMTSYVFHDADSETAMLFKLAFV